MTTIFYEDMPQICNWFWADLGSLLGVQPFLIFLHHYDARKTFNYLFALLKAREKEREDAAGESRGEHIRSCVVRLLPWCVCSSST